MSDSNKLKLRKGDLFVWNDCDVGVVIAIWREYGLGWRDGVLSTTGFDVYYMNQVRSSSRIVAREPK